MKKLLQASVALLLFAASILIIQSSCSKSQAQVSSGATTQLNKIVYLRSGTPPEIWISDYDGSNAFKVPVIMPEGTTISSDFGHWEARLSPDGQTIFFLGMVKNTSTDQIFSCRIDGSNVSVVVPNPEHAILGLGGAY